MADSAPSPIWESLGWDHDLDYLDEVLDDFLDEFEFGPYE